MFTKNAFIKIVSFTGFMLAMSREYFTAVPNPFEVVVLDRNITTGTLWVTP